ncbi:cytochrome o ubiquinol oxidase subunit III [Saccharicrinis sp. FJH2]|uniref:cytochrome o ubiquinol oxidase subunit III n=1 Tax=Saccharicrinis sp. FJH65 TaxID=3344659 RepID=UPI0035F4AEB2
MNESVKHNDEIHNSGLADLKAFGFWIYLMSDLILFSILFSAFAVVGHNYAGGPSPKDLFNLPYLFGETTFLLVSSVTMGFSIIAMLKDNKKFLLIGLVITFILGLGFIIMELNEFHHLISEGYGPQRSSFLSSFFTLVGMHGTHVTFGLLWILVMLFQVYSKGMTQAVKSRIYRLSMFWHFLDIVWIGVFSVVYLLGVV